MSSESTRSMRWGALVGAVVVALGGARVARADGAPAPAPAAAPAPATDVPAAPASLTATPASAAPAATNNAVTATAPAPEAAKGEDRPVYFEGLGLDLNLSDGTGLYAGNEAYQNDWTIFIAPSWRIGERYFKDLPALRKLNLGLRFALTGEFAGTGEQYRTGQSDPSGAYAHCDDTAPGEQGGTVAGTPSDCQGGAARRMDYSDIGIRLGDTFYTIPGAGIEISGSLGSVIPVSKESQTSNFITSIQPGVGLSRSFFGKKLTISYNFGFTKYFHSSNVPVYDDQLNELSIPDNVALGKNALTSNGDALAEFATAAGGLNSSYGLSHAVSVSYAPDDKFTFLARYVIADTFAGKFSECGFDEGSNAVSAGTIDLCQNGRDVAANSGAGLLDRGDHGIQQFWLVADYQVLDYLGLEASLITVAPQRKQNGSWQQPFLTTDYRNYTNVNLSVTLTVESLAAKIFHKS